MAIINREFDASEQKIVIHCPLGAVATSITRELVVAPYPCEVIDVKETSLGLSGAPVHAMSIDRFIVGSGLTNVTGGWTNLTIVALGTSGVQDYPQVASGNSLIQLQASDVLKLVSSGANTATADSQVTITIRALQDQKTYFGA